MNRNYPEILEQLIEFFKKLPGVGEKSAERMTLAVLNLPLSEIELWSDVLLKAKKILHPCPVCGNLTDLELCEVCSDEGRDHNLICVVEDFKSAFAFEKSKNFRGVYHVLNGLISPIDEIGAEDINLASLKERVGSLENPELILALKSSIEGETTTLYIKKIFENSKVKISRLAYGLPIGAEIDYLDNTTIDRALEDRIRISE